MKPCILALGPMSVVLNSLPLAKQMADAGERPAFAIADEFKSVLQSVSYVDPVPVPGSYENLRTTMDNLSRQYRVIQLQCKGHGYIVPKPIGQSWNEECYNLAGKHQEFCGGQYETLVLDRRYEHEEAALIAANIGDDKRPIILVNLQDSAGSQFTFGSQVMELIASRFGEECRIIDIKGMRTRVGNLLGLFERASFLITADNAMLHLAAACPTLPYIAFIASTPTLWHGSYTRANCLLRIRYDQYTYWPLAITKLIAYAINPPKHPWKLIHAYHIAPVMDPGTWRRNKNAERTWKAARVLGHIEDVGLTLEDLPRTFQDSDRKMAYTKDMIDAGAAKCTGEGKEAIMLCNTDTCFSIDMYDQIVKIMDTGIDGFCGPRRDFAHIDEAIHPSQIHGGQDYAGMDIFVFTSAWWKKWRHEFPDMVHGSEAWDCVLRWQMVFRDKLPVVPNLIYHERHVSRWTQRGNINTLPSQRHNIKLAVEAFEAMNKNHGFDWKPGMFGIDPRRLGPLQVQQMQQPVRRPAPPLQPHRQIVHPPVRAGRHL